MKPMATFVLNSVIIIAFLMAGIRIEAAEDDHIWLRVDGKNIVTSSMADPPNQIFCPVGTVYQPDAREGRMELFARFMKARSLNTVRYYFRVTDYKDNNNDYNFDSTLAVVHQWLDVARRYRIYTIFDNHEYLGHSNISYDSESVYSFWKANFKKLAESVKNNPWVLGYEIMNEIYTYIMTPEELKARMVECVQAIREVDSSHIIFFAYPHGTGVMDFNDIDVIDPPQIVLTPHAYPTEGGTAFDKAASWDGHRNTYDFPVLTTEFGAGMGANGLTYQRDAPWLAEFVDALDHFQMGWTVWWFGPAWVLNNANTSIHNAFGAAYGPDFPEIWYPAAKKMSEKYPIPNNGIPIKIAFDPAPVWFPEFMAAGDETNLVLRVVDTTGSMVTGYNASVAVSVSGPALLSNMPAHFTSGKATVTVKSTGNEGTVGVTATSGSLNGSQTLTIAKKWGDFQIQNLDNSWIDSGDVTDNYSPSCRISICHPSKGINLNNVYYEYSVDGGESWVYWDDDESDNFDGASLNTAKWTAENHNSSGGSASVSDGALTIRGSGDDVWSTWNNSWTIASTFAKDEFYYVHEERNGDFEIITRISSQQRTDPMSLAGILVRDGMEDTPSNGYCYVAATPDSGYVFGWKYLGKANNGGDKANFKYIDARTCVGDVTYPSYLKLTKITHPGNYEGTGTGYSRRYKIYSASYSADGNNWTAIDQKLVFRSGETQRVGLFVCSGVSGTHSEAVFDFYRVRLKATHLDSTATTMYSNGAEQFQTGIIPFMNDVKRQEVRFRAYTAVPFLDYINSVGEELISPRYPVFDGENVSVRIAHADMPTAKLNAIAARGGIRLNYTITHKRVTNLNFAIYDLKGRTVWAHLMRNPARTGSVLLEQTSAGISAGTYVVRMDARMAETGKTLRVQNTIHYTGK